MTLTKKEMLINKINEATEVVNGVLENDIDYALVEACRKAAVKDIRNGTEEYINDLYERCLG